MRVVLFLFFGLYISSFIYANDHKVLQFVDSTKHYWRSDSKKAQHFADKAFEQCDSTNYELYAECIKNLGILYYFNSQPDSAVAKYKKALVLFSKANSNVGISKILNNLGVIEMEQGNYDNALTYYNQSYELGLSMMDTALIVNAKINIANIFYYLGNYTKSLESSFVIENYLKGHKNMRSEARNYEIMYSSYQSLFDIDNFRIFAEKALNIYKSLSDSIGIATTYTNMANAYEFFDDINAAIELNNKALMIFTSINYSVGITHVLNMLGNNYRNTKKYELSTTCFLKAYQKALADNNKLQVKNIANELYINSLIKEDLYTARIYQHIYDSINNLFVDEKINSQIAEMQVKYETLEKEQEIKQQQLQLKNERKTRLLISIGALLLLIIATAWTLLYRAKQNQKQIELSRKKADVENKLLRSQMNPHFMFNSLNSVQNFILKNDKMQACNYLSNFSDLIRDILQNSRQSFIPLDEELETLEKYLKLEQLRFKDKLDYKISTNLTVDASEINIPPMILQPYIENAIIHGIAPKESMGKIDITIENKQQQLIKCTIQDNGIGRVAASKIKKPTNAKSLGMLVTSERLQLLQTENGINTEVTITDLFDGDIPVGTRVELILPIENLA